MQISVYEYWTLKVTVLYCTSLLWYYFFRMKIRYAAHLLGERCKLFDFFQKSRRTGNRECYKTNARSSSLVAIVVRTKHIRTNPHLTASFLIIRFANAPTHGFIIPTSDEYCTFHHGYTLSSILVDNEHPRFLLLKCMAWIMMYAQAEIIIVLEVFAMLCKRRMGSWVDDAQQQGAFTCSDLLTVFYVFLQHK